MNKKEKTIFWTIFIFLLISVFLIYRYQKSLGFIQEAIVDYTPQVEGSDERCLEVFKLDWPQYADKDIDCKWNYESCSHCSRECICDVSEGEIKCDDTIIWEKEHSKATEKKCVNNIIQLEKDLRFELK